MLAGLHTATWGMYKDSIHEGFFWPRYFRSPIVGAMMGVIAYLIARPGLASAASIVSFFGVVYVLERGAVELWKTFLRNEDQSKYFIPMQFAVFGNVVQSQSRRYIIGAIISTAVCGTFLAVHYGAPRLDLRITPGPCSRLRRSAGGFPRFSARGKMRRSKAFSP